MSSDRRRDRTGELVDDDEHGCPHRCLPGGWLTDPAEAETPMPCPRCRPWTRRRARARQALGPGSTRHGREQARALYTTRTEEAHR